MQTGSYVDVALTQSERDAMVTLTLLLNGTMGKTIVKPSYESKDHLYQSTIDTLARTVLVSR